MDDMRDRISRAVAMNTPAAADVLHLALARREGFGHSFLSSPTCLTTKKIRNQVKVSFHLIKKERKKTRKGNFDSC